jgi:uncharacterized beta-barrel protein YwiB (DUF1934 family)
MKQKILLSLCGKQTYHDQEPEIIELTTEGTLEFLDNGWDICYEESELTGLQGVTTSFRVEQGKVTLTRNGALRSEMVFQQGLVHDSLYQMDFGTLMLRTCTEFLFFDITPEGGVVDIAYRVEIENSEAGFIDYHLQFRTIG